MQPPRLVVVVSFDQFRGDYLSRFDPHFTTNSGFRRLTLGGAVFPNCRYDHANNITGPGHATLLTGCYPARTGIVGNDFCELSKGTCGYCARGDDGAYSAEKLRVPALGDVLRATSPRSKVVGIALKDRAAILMAGKAATTCLWYDSKAQSWTTSSAYRTPQWLDNVNAVANVKMYGGAQWRPVLKQTEKVPDDSVDGEGNFPGGTNAFPHQIPDSQDQLFMAGVMCSPFSMEMLFNAALEVIDRDRLGVDAHPDILCIGVSSTDYVGHIFGPDSREVMDMAVRADRHISHLIDHLDLRVGRSNYVLVVTSDHGVAPIPEIIQRQAEQQKVTIDAGRIREAEIKSRIDSVLSLSFGVLPPDSSYVREIFEPSVYLNWSRLVAARREDVIADALKAVTSHPGIGIALSSDQLIKGSRPETIAEDTWRFIRNSTHADRTGEIVLYPKQYWIIGSNAATHGTPYDYDRWVPMVWFGGVISPNVVDAACAPVDIAPTLAELLGLRLDDPDGKRLPLTLRNPGPAPKTRSKTR